ncbi:phage tail sheath subtilisin-like domain-containing protein [Methylosoma difficile]
MINFDTIPASLRVPGAYIEIDGSMASLDTVGQPSMLLVGLKRNTGEAVANEIVLVASLTDAVKKAGEGSMLAAMAKRYYAITPLMQVFILPLAAPVTGNAATAMMTITSMPDETEVFSFYLAGELIEVSILVADGQSISNARTRIVAAINAVGICVVASAGEGNGEIVLECIHNGSFGNDIGLSVVSVPSGMELDIEGFSGGTLVPDLIGANGLGAIFDNDESGYLYSVSRYIALGLNDAATLSSFHIESQRRYAPPIQSGFRIFTAFSGDYEGAIAYGADKNFEHVTCICMNNGITSIWDAAAIVAASAAPELFNNPVKSLEGVALKGLKSGTKWTFEQQNALLFSGLSLVQKSRDGTSSIKRLISMYLHRPDDSLDDAYLDINTTEVMERIRYEQRLGAIMRFTGKAAAKSDENYRPGLPIVTLDTLRAYLLTLYKDTLMREYGWVQEYEHYKNTLVIEQDPTNASRFNYIDQPVILSPFYILAGKAQFRKEV